MVLNMMVVYMNIDFGLFVKGKNDSSVLFILFLFYLFIFFICSGFCHTLK